MNDTPEAHIDITESQDNPNIPPKIDPPTPEEMAEAAKRRKEVRDLNREQIGVLALNNAAAAQSLLMAELVQYINPETGVPSGKQLHAQAVAKMKGLADIAVLCDKLL